MKMKKKLTFHWNIPGAKMTGFRYFIPFTLTKEVLDCAGGVQTGFDDFGKEKVEFNFEV